MAGEKISSIPPPAYEQHPGPETHQPAPMVPQNAHMQPPSPLPEHHPQQQPVSQPPVQEYHKAGPGTGRPSGYNTATPLHALQRGPTPVDCPVCGSREMTRVEAQTGNTTQ
ncbi:LITAF-like zinc ribbon domain-containing protein [Aspergillus thermomutatus]|uniref:Uncharacterized protein n=1 Tax=Aspergillus thermomutatus TaxID=41047 RepID=A0A397HKI4_ASPTH|nr:uncharacterized protein CDV56_106869 [Aspergillus thermomutatus]RHZ63595.1 hypothetical protein CDV56_106869 [Aspergillus thermomutatus]